ncbi:asparagine synthase (glutamine-hydrolyzing) [Myxococcota bacterium]|nr:asparagine synthase (glutamine-hydrolyzing) [Myxococcota bacterium]MBU1430239.1 asparagine synthase (glutamine-hydrolyzing) [Myxococcota bacterium]MBU1898349.1 asparagine synthase (glutamine-hydrolyzing) [Myxococcota bacterium]
MCGLVGVLERRGAADAGRVRLMTRALAHRGPDGEGVITLGPLGLGHRRLAVIDTSRRAAQPMRTSDGRFTLVYNGAIYNFQALRAALEARGEVFTSQGDTEVLLRAFAAWGLDVVERLNGMFAFAVWDSLAQRLTLARDRHGIKPLYYADTPSAFLFGSEVKALLQHPALRVRVSPEALNEYFTFQNIFSDRTLFEGVHLLPAGCTLTLSPGGAPITRRYWDYHFTEDETLSEEEALGELERRFEQAVERQLVADVEIGAYLSGGIDSASVVGQAARHQPRLRTFTCGFDLSSASGLELKFDERAAAERLANAFQTEHYQVVLKAGDMERVLPELIWHLEDPRVGQSYPNLYAAQLASRFVKVVLSGTGGDELFAGYPWRYAASGLGARGQEDFIARHFAYWQRLVPDALRGRFFRDQTVPEDYTARVFQGVYQDQLGGTRPQDYVKLALYFDTKTFLHGLLLVEDKLGMRNRIETRYPFLDNDLVELAQRIPIAYNLHGFRHIEAVDENDLSKKVGLADGKQLLRRMLARTLPHDITQAPKQGFSAPDGSWFKGKSLDYIRRLLLNPRARIYEHLERDAVGALLDDHFQGRANRRLFIWSCLCFEWWLRTFDA